MSSWLDHTSELHPSVSVRRMSMATLAWGTAIEQINAGDRVEIRVDHQTGRTTVCKARRSSTIDESEGSCDQ